MSILDAMTIDSTEIVEAKNKIVRAIHATAAAAYDYAEASLNASMVCYRAAENGDPVAVAYTAYADVPRFGAAAQRMIETCADLASLSCALHESAEDEANMAYADHLMDMSKTDKVSAMLEAAATRMKVVNAALPQIIAPGARFNTAIFAPKE